MFFDHFGCASSKHLPETAGDKSFWTPELSTAQLDSLIHYLSLRDGPGFDFLGQSFGGMIGSAWAGTRPRGLMKLILASANASKELSMEAIYSGEKTSNYDEPAYKAAIGQYMKTFLCRADSFLEEMMQANKNLAEDKTVFSTMSGPAFLNHTGSMLGWTAIPVLHNINVPTLMYNGEFDTAHEVSQVPIFEKIPKIRWVTIAGAGHMPHLENEERKDKFMKLVGEFLMQSLD